MTPIRTSEDSVRVLEASADLGAQESEMSRSPQKDEINEFGTPAESPMLENEEVSDFESEIISTPLTSEVKKTKMDLAE